jgi:hypothetical protein
MAIPDVVPTPATEPDSSSKLRALHHQAMERYAGIDSYMARLRRREQVNGRDKPEELLLFKFRKQPYSVYFKWLGSEGSGREVVYVQGRYGSLLHTLLAAGDMPFTPAGRRMALAPDNLLVRSASRHAITEAGIGNLIDCYGKLVTAQERDSHAGSLRYLGPHKRPEYERPLEAVEETVRPGSDPQLPQGGRRWWMFDLASHLPVILITHDHVGHEVEYYCYDRIQPGVHLDDRDFDPDQLWPEKKKPG